LDQKLPEKFSTIFKLRVSLEGFFVDIIKVVSMLILIKSNMVKKKTTREGFCMCCKSKDNLQVSINLLSNPAYLCSKCISDYDSWKKKKRD